MKRTGIDLGMAGSAARGVALSNWLGGTMDGSENRQIARDSLFVMADLRLPGAEDEHRIKVRNLSAGGMMGEGSVRVMRGSRVEVNIRPENGPSLRVVEKLGLRDEGLRKRYLHIRGSWADHRTFALTVEEVPDGLLGRWRRYQAAHPR